MSQLAFPPLGRPLRAALACVAAGVVLIGCTSRFEGLDASKMPEEVRDDYALFARRCSKCHSLARPLTAGITDDEQWVMYVNRMRRQPGSGISPDDQVHILRFLRYYAGELRRKEAERKAPPTSTPVTPSSTTSAPLPPLPPPTPVPSPSSTSPAPPASSTSPTPPTNGAATLPKGAL